MKIVIKEKDLQEASICAFLEARRWRECSLKLEDNSNLDRETMIMYAFSTELFLKSILLAENCNLSLDDYFHNLKRLFNKLNLKTQKEIKSKIKIVPQKIMLLDGDIVSIKKFGGYLDKISNDYVNLRYCYERISNRKSLLYFHSFHKDFNSALNDYCTSLFVK